MLLTIERWIFFHHLNMKTLLIQEHNLSEKTKQTFQCMHKHTWLYFVDSDKCYNSIAKDNLSNALSRVLRLFRVVIAQSYQQLINLCLHFVPYAAELVQVPWINRWGIVKVPILKYISGQPLHFVGTVELRATTTATYYTAEVLCVIVRHGIRCLRSDINANFLPQWLNYAQNAGDQDWVGELENTEQTCMTSTAPEWIPVPASIPEDATPTRLLLAARRNPCAIWLRQLLWLHKNMTFSLNAAPCEEELKSMDCKYKTRDRVCLGNSEENSRKHTCRMPANIFSLRSGVSSMHCIAVRPQMMASTEALDTLLLALAPSFSF